MTIFRDFQGPRPRRGIGIARPRHSKTCLETFKPSVRRPRAQLRDRRITIKFPISQLKKGITTSKILSRRTQILAYRCCGPPPTITRYVERQMQSLIMNFMKIKKAKKSQTKNIQNCCFRHGIVVMSKTKMRKTNRHS